MNPICVKGRSRITCGYVVRQNQLQRDDTSSSGLQDRTRYGRIIERNQCFLSMDEKLGFYFRELSKYMIKVKWEWEALW